MSSIDPDTFIAAVTRLHLIARDVAQHHLPDDGGYLSPLLPTLKFGRPAFARFAAGMSKAPPPTVASSDAWIVVGVNPVALLGFLTGPIAARYGVTPPFTRTSVGPVAEVKLARKRLDALVADASIQFFAGGAATAPAVLSDAFEAAYCADEQEAFRVGFPDFFRWFEGH